MNFIAEIIYAVVLSVINLSKYDGSEKLVLNIGNILFPRLKLVFLSNDPSHPCENQIISRKEPLEIIIQKS